MKYLPDRFDQSALHQVIDRVLDAALKAVEPGQAVKNYVHLESDLLTVNEARYNLKTYSNVWVISLGKASIAMTESLASILGQRLTGGVVVPKHIPHRQSGLPKSIMVISGDHPIPGVRSVQAANAIIELTKNIQPDDLVFCLISGGGSSLVTAPQSALQLEDIQRVTDTLLTSGASIHEMNCIRKHLDLLKGGGLARMVAPTRMITLILSDVLDNSLDVIASGPTFCDPTTYLDAYDVINKYMLFEKTPGAILKVFQAGIRGELVETVKPGDTVLNNVNNVMVGSNYLAASAALLQARDEGLNAFLLTSFMQGEAREIGGFLGAIARQGAISGEPFHPPACIIVGGETTVTIRGNGFGGRNLETAMGAIKMMRGLKQCVFVTLATDGEDGPTDAAGGIVDGDTWNTINDRGLSLEDALANNNSYPLFKELGNLLQIGPTGTNVNDLAFIFYFDNLVGKN